MKVKTVEIEGKQYAELNESGQVLYDNDGKEMAFDAAQTYGKITDLTREAADNRKAKEDLDKKLKSFEGLDPEKYQEAIEKLSKIDQKQLIDAGEIDRVKQEIANGFQEKLDESETRYKTLEERYNGEKMSAEFSRSKFINDQLAIPADIAQAHFGRHFKLEDGKLRGYDSNGEPIYSKSKPGEIASFDEAMETLVGSYQHRDRILKGSGASGTGGDGGSGTGGKRRISRAQYEQLGAADQAAVAQAMREGKAEITS